MFQLLKKQLMDLITVKHSMEPNHFIEWIELIADRVVYHQALSACDKPIAEFCVKASRIKAKELCSIHSLWCS